MPESTHPDEELTALLLAVRAGCRPSFARLYGLTSPRLFGIVLRVNTDRAEPKMCCKRSM